MTTQPKREPLKIHMRGVWHGAKMGWARCGSYVRPFATNLTDRRSRATCAKCKRLRELRSGRKRGADNA